LNSIKDLLRRRSRVARRRGISTPPISRSLNERRLPRFAPPGEPLRQRIDLIVMAAGKRQQLGNKSVEPRSVLGQQDRAALEQVDLRNEALLLVPFGFVVDDVDLLFA
jgi:hypothetical protein